MKKIIILGILLILVLAGCTSNKELRENAPLEEIDSGSAAGTTTPTETVKPAEESPPVYGLNDRVLIGNLAYTFKEVKWKDNIGSYIGDNFFGAEADGIFMIVVLSVENVGDESESLSNSYIKIIDDQRREFEADTSAAIYLDSDPELKAENLEGIVFDSLNPGLKKDFAIVFDVPPDTKGLIQIVDNLFSASEVAYVKWE